MRETPYSWAPEHLRLTFGQGAATDLTSPASADTAGTQDDRYPLDSDVEMVDALMEDVRGKPRPDPEAGMEQENIVATASLTSSKLLKEVAKETFKVVQKVLGALTYCHPHGVLLNALPDLPQKGNPQRKCSVRVVNVDSLDAAIYMFGAPLPASSAQSTSKPPTVLVLVSRDSISQFLERTDL